VNDGVVGREMIGLSLDQHGDVTLQECDHFIVGVAVLFANNCACYRPLNVFNAKIFCVEISVHIDTSLQKQYTTIVPEMQGLFEKYAD
jgi:hypothetical protein